MTDAPGHRGEAGALPSPVLAVVAITVVVAGVAGTTWTHFVACAGPIARLTEAEASAAGTGDAPTETSTVSVSEAFKPISWTRRLRTQPAPSEPPAPRSSRPSTGPVSSDTDKPVTKGLGRQVRIPTNGGRGVSRRLSVPQKGQRARHSASSQEQTNLRKRKRK